jgi:ABC-type phosphate/phosphonate transport system substrate-binding protein
MAYEGHWPRLDNRLHAIEGHLAELATQAGADRAGLEGLVRVVDDTMSVSGIHLLLDQLRADAISDQQAAAAELRSAFEQVEMVGKKADGAAAVAAAAAAAATVVAADVAQVRGGSAQNSQDLGKLAERMWPQEAGLEALRVQCEAQWNAAQTTV